MKFKLKKGDLVVITTGKDKGVRGPILAIDRDKARVFVEGATLASRHMKPSSTHPEGGIVKKNLGLHISNVMLVDPLHHGDSAQTFNKTALTRIGIKFNEAGEKIRYAKRSGTVIGSVR
jgi:large subunit ribosomal protein L24